MIRPQLARQIHRWREPLAGAGVLAFGLWLAATSWGALFFIGCGLASFGAATIYTGLRRARFPRHSGGPGVVEVDERRITYFGPAGGGSISVDDLTRVILRTSNTDLAGASLVWDFSDSEGNTISIPADAENAEALLDALSALSGVDYDAVQRADIATGNVVIPVWQKRTARLH